MSVKYQEDGTIITFNGDSFKIRISDILTNKNYKVYFEVRDKNNEVIFEIMEESNNNEYVIFSITKENTEKCSVPTDKTKEIYYYGIKICFDDEEHTVTVKNTEFGKRNKFIVCAKKAEGNANV